MEAFRPKTRTMARYTKLGIKALAAVLVGSCLHTLFVIYSSDKDFLVITELSSFEQNKALKSVMPWQHIKVKSVNDHWQLYKDSKREILVYSAFYDNRTATGKLPVIRILAVASGIRENTSCMLWYSAGKPPEMSKLTIDKTGRGDKINNIQYGQFLFTCFLKDVSPIPTHVSIVANELSKNTTILLPVVLPAHRHSNNQFAICVAISFGTIPPAQFVEWMEYSILFGVSEVHVYNATLSDEIKLVFDYYVKRNVLKVHQMPPPVYEYSRTAAKLGSPASLNDCMMRNMYRVSYIIVLDFDEIIVPRMDPDYSSMLTRIDQQQGLGKPWVSYTFRNVYYWLDSPADLTQPQHLITLRYKQRSTPSRWLFASKSFIDPRSCLSVFNHYCYLRFRTTDKKWTVDVNTTIASSHHYKKCTYGKKTCDEYGGRQSNDTYMLKYKDIIVERTSSVLRLTGHWADNL